MSEWERKRKRREMAPLKETKAGIIKISLVIGGIFAFCLIVQQAGLLSNPLSSVDNSNTSSLKLHRMALAESKNLAEQNPWQELGECKAQLEKLSSGGLGISVGNNMKVENVNQICPKCESKVCPLCNCASFADDPTGAIASLEKENNALKAKVVELEKAFNRLLHEKSKLDSMGGGKNFVEASLSEDSLKAARDAIETCGKISSSSSNSKKISEVVNTKGYLCEATEEDFAKYFNFTVRKACPDDWFFVQELIFVKNCFSLPRRRCISRTPRQLVEPLPYPVSLWDQNSLNDLSVRWDLHYCKSFECLNTRIQGDCRNCFNLNLEEHRWRSFYRGNLKMEDVINMKKGSLRIGLDAGGGTGSFAARMASYNVTILTTAMNIETVVGKVKGLPYMEAIALRGLVPLHLPHRARLPFFDNSLDVVHSVNSIKYLPLEEFEELVMEWDRVLRPGGIMWFEMFYAPVTEMPLYIAILDLLGYNPLHWNLTPKPDPAERSGDHVYLNCVIEKPARED